MDIEDAEYEAIDLLVKWAERNTFRSMGFIKSSAVGDVGKKYEAIAEIDKRVKASTDIDWTMLLNHISGALEDAYVSGYRDAKNETKNDALKVAKQVGKLIEDGNIKEIDNPPVD